MKKLKNESNKEIEKLTEEVQHLKRLSTQRKKEIRALASEKVDLRVKLAQLENQTADTIILSQEEFSTIKAEVESLQNQLKEFKERDLQQGQAILEKDQTIIELQHEIEYLRKQLEQSKESVLEFLEKEQAIKQDLVDH